MLNLSSVIINHLFQYYILHLLPHSSTQNIYCFPLENPIGFHLQNISRIQPLFIVSTTPPPYSRLLTYLAEVIERTSQLFSPFRVYPCFPRVYNFQHSNCESLLLQLKPIITILVA